MPNRSTGEKTKIILADSLRKIMKKKPLDKIKIREIVEECGLNRQTFYYHFQDIYALVEWMYRYDGEKIIKEKFHNNNIREVCAVMIDYLEKNREELICVMDSKAEMYFFDFLYKGVSDCFDILITQKAKNFDISLQYKKFLSHYNTNSVVGVIRDWLKSVDADRPTGEELLTMFSITTNGALKLALQNYKKMTEED